MSFSSVLGHDKPISQLRSFLKSGRIPSALLFYGPEGTGKRMTALEMAKTLNCAQRKGEDCCDVSGTSRSSDVDVPDTPENCCSSCVQAGKGVHPDVRIVDAVYQAGFLGEAAEKQKIIRVDTIREISKEMGRKSLSGGWKVSILDDAHHMNVSAQNAFLKILEEPPPGTVWILVTHLKERLLPTILSRSQPVYFSRLRRDEAAKILMDSGDIPAEEASFLAELSDGSILWARRFRNALEELREHSSRGPMAPFALAESLPRELPPARAKIECILNLLLQQQRKIWKSRPEKGVPRAIGKILNLKKLLEANVSPGLIAQIALLETEESR